VSTPLRPAEQLEVDWRPASGRELGWAANAAGAARAQQSRAPRLPRRITQVITLGAPFALTAVKSVSNAGSQAKVATFDTNAALVDAVKSGDVEWAIDQQPFLQGYLAVDQLWLYMNSRNIIGGGQPVLTGPAFIDETNIDSIAELAKNGTR
jgi:simple sugar transport system substrate-binding protein